MFLYLTGLLQVSSSSTWSNSSNDLSKTKHPFGIDSKVDWMKNPESVKPIIVLTIYGVKAERYVCMDKRGRVYSSVSQILIILCL